MNTPHEPPIARPARRFSADQRVALYLASDGRCAICGKALPAGWHADHWEPYAAGGATDVTNGQALCPECNLQKGASMATKLEEWPGVTLLLWQNEAFDAYLKKDAQDFTLVASPGAGKTVAALRIAHDSLRFGRSQILIVVVPTDNLREQWAEKAHKEAGIQLQSDWTKRNPFGIEADFHGFVVTYQQVANNADIFRMIVNQRRAFVILDEVHHVADRLTWGRMMENAFGPAARRLLMSGTLFREDQCRIPFITYADNGQGTRESVADYTYGYKDALRDDVCRPVLFPHHEGEMVWREGAVIKAFSFADEASEQEQARRLVTAVDPAGDWLRHIIFEAHGDLQDLRNSWNAAAMLVAIDQDHAKRCAALLERVTGVTPVVVISEDDTASKQIDAFKESTQPWIVSVKMVSEGIDIPRLCVGVYASNVTTELYFRQVVGRFVRVGVGPAGQMASLYVPGDPRLVAHCLAIKEERKAALEAIDADAREQYDEYLRKRGQADPFETLSSSPGDERLVFDGQEYDADLTTRARRMCADMGKAGAEFIAFAAEILKRTQGPTPTAAARPAQRKTEDNRELREKLRKSGDRKAKTLGTMLHEVMGLGKRDGGIYKAVNNKIIRQVGAAVEMMTLEQLTERSALLERWLAYLVQQQRDGRGGAWLMTWLND